MRVLQKKIFGSVALLLARLDTRLPIDHDNADKDLLTKPFALMEIKKCSVFDEA
jgi:hypothetical protein